MNRRNADPSLGQLLARGALFFAALVLLDQASKLDMQSAEATAAIVAEHDAWVAGGRLLKPKCPDQWIAQRGANEPWQVACVTASTEAANAR